MFFFAQSVFLVVSSKFGHQLKRDNRYSFFSRFQLNWLWYNRFKKGKSTKVHIWVKHLGSETKLKLNIFRSKGGFSAPLICNDNNYFMFDLTYFRFIFVCKIVEGSHFSSMCNYRFWIKTEVELTLALGNMLKHIIETLLVYCMWWWYFLCLKIYW